MIIASKVVTMLAGSYLTLPDPELMYVTILRVKRNGLGYNRVSGLSIGNREFVQVPEDGMVQFGIAADVNEEVFVKYKF